MSGLPDNIIIIIADSLRYDSVYQNHTIDLPYATKYSTQFLNASSAGCWTLPATSSIFTGLLPHQHGATAQSRNIFNVPTLAEKLKEKGYNTYQITSNVATTEIFGLDRGFDQVFKAWELKPAHHAKLFTLLMMLGKPRIRKKIVDGDFISQKFSEDLKAGSVWLESYMKTNFDKAHQLLADGKKSGSKNFIFINLMETHFPYHINSLFKFLSSGYIKKFKEAKGLFNMVNQSFLKNDRKKVSSHVLKAFKERQRLSWNLIKKPLDTFIESIHKDQNNLVVFGADHGENFGDQDWVYHFSNVTDACTRVPLLWLDNESLTSSLNTCPMSSRGIYHSILQKVGYQNHSHQSLFSNEVETIPVSQSYWYNHQGKTQEKYKYNQFVFNVDGKRYLKRNDDWYRGEMTQLNKGAEIPFERIQADFHDISTTLNPQVASYIKNQLESYHQFEVKLR